MNMLLFCFCLYSIYCLCYRHKVIDMSITICLYIYNRCGILAIVWCRIFFGSDFCSEFQSPYMLEVAPCATGHWNVYNSRPTTNGRQRLPCGIVAEKTWVRVTKMPMFLWYLAFSFCLIIRLHLAAICWQHPPSPCYSVLYWRTPTRAITGLANLNKNYEICEIVYANETKYGFWAIAFILVSGSLFGAWWRCFVDKGLCLWRQLVHYESVYT